MYSLILFILYIIYIFVLYKKQNDKIEELAERIMDLEIENSENKLEFLKLNNKLDENKTNLINR